MSEATGWERIRVEQDGPVVVVTLTRADKRNALDDTMIDELHLALSLLDEEPATRVVVLRGDGPDFCAGADLAQLEKVAAGADPAENLADAPGRAGQGSPPRATWSSPPSRHPSPTRR